LQNEQVMKTTTPLAQMQGPTQTRPKHQAANRTN
jgi:hypothetical protein